ncbi:uncharacterized protein LOC141642453 [Silene latifolia]|uniref:uncharacterized protein LOC141642453 n=1 Tax=Silene latifolia TaxID=37657 RepID=UPI003D788C89
MTIGGTQAYGEASYWDRRYTQDQSPFDWYQNYSALSPLLNLYLSPSNRLLVVGCGNSAFSEGMANDGYEDIVNIDISSVVIEAMQKKYSNSSKLTYITMDVRNMSAFQTGSFDAVIDKGTLDSILCGDNSKQNSSMMLEEVRRVLKDNGVYILITYGVPAFRLDLLRNAGNWNIKLHIIEKIVTGVRYEGQRKWELTNPFPLDEDGKSLEDVFGKNPDIHYIYVCTKETCI